MEGGSPAKKRQKLSVDENEVTEEEKARQEDELVSSLNSADIIDGAYLIDSFPL